MPRRNHKDGGIGLRATRDHVPDEVAVPGGIDDRGPADSAAQPPRTVAQPPTPSHLGAGDAVQPGAPLGPHACLHIEKAASKFAADYARKVQL